MEELESKTESYVEKKDRIDFKEANLNKALMKLSKDVEVYSSLENTEIQIQKEKLQIESFKEELLYSLQDVLKLMEEIENENNNSLSTLEMLENIGEDVEEGKNIIGQRFVYLEECKKRIEHLSQMLGEEFNLDFINHQSKNDQTSLEKNLEDTEIENLNKRKAGVSQDPVSVLFDYFQFKNYKPAKFDEYIVDPTWRTLYKKAYPDADLPEVDRQLAKKALLQYKINNKETSDEYRKDPMWQFLSLRAYPDNIQIIETWIKQINPHFHDKSLSLQEQNEYKKNCGACAYLLDQYLNGVNIGMQAGRINIGYDADMEQKTGRKCVYMDVADIEQILLKKGAGSSLIVGINRKRKFFFPVPGHWFNAYYDGHSIRTLDAQTGQIYGWPPDYGNISAWCAMI